MRANELMIHNYVSFEGHPVCITKIGLTGIEGYLYKNDTLHDVKLKYEDIEPIPITEELLLRNGFKNFDKKWFELRGVKKCTDMFFYYDEQHLPEHWRLLIKNEEVMDLCTAYISHLHQLQNLCNIADVEMEWKV